MIPNTIKRRHVLQALVQIDRDGVPSARVSRGYQLLHEGKRYPPKYTVAVAGEIATGRFLSSDDFGGGKETNGFLQRLGFVILGKDGKAVTRQPAAAANPASKHVEVNPTPRAKTVRHDERCSECKNIIADMLRVIYGTTGVVRREHKVSLQAKLESYADHPRYLDLRRVHEALQRHRGHQEFVKTSTVRPCDIFVAPPGFIVEFDESQHFTAAREVALKAYPDNLPLGFDADHWAGLCRELRRSDPEPRYRDEQRAWYDAIRDFAPSLQPGTLPTVRVRMGGYPWCELDPGDTGDVAEFQRRVPGLPAPTRPRSRRPPNGFRLARAVLDIGVTRGQAEALGAGSDRPAWSGSFEAIRNSHNADPEAYWARIFRLADEAVQRGADCLLLPACTIFYRSDDELRTYLARLEHLPWVVSGLWGCGTGPFEAFGEGEQAAVIQQGRIVQRFDGHFPWNVGMGPWNLYTAISSTIGAVRDSATKTCAEHPPNPKHPVLALDMGHNQYGGRYTKTLKSVRRHLMRTRRQPATVILAFWHYRHSSSSCPWAYADSERITGYERVQLRADGVNDWLDIIDLGTTPVPEEG